MSEDRKRKAASILRRHLRNLYDALDLLWESEDDDDADRFVDLIVDQAVEEARNERKGIATAPNARCPGCGLEGTPVTIRPGRHMRPAYPGDKRNLGVICDGKPPPPPLPPPPLPPPRPEGLDDLHKATKPPKDPT